MNVKALRFAIIGCGGIGQTHAKVIKAMENVRLVAVSSRKKERVDAFAKKFECNSYTDYNEMLAREDIDVVIICSPSGTHAEIGAAAAIAGKHVMVEKPIDISLESADKLIKICKEKGVKLSCISQCRFSEDFNKLKNAVDEGQVGQLNFGEAHTKFFRGQDYYDSGFGRGTMERDGGGALIIQGYHYVDLLHDIMGPVDEVFSYCATRAHNMEAEDIALATIKFASGALGLIEANTTAFPGFYPSLGIYGNDGAIVLQGNIIKEWKVGNPQMKFGGEHSFENRDVNRSNYD